MPPLLHPALVDVIARAWCLVEVGGLTAIGPQRGRQFERLFYGVCRARGVPLFERAGSVTLGGRGSASGYRHEVDAASRGADFRTHWELKHLSGGVPKNELLVFNGKGIDFLHGAPASSATLPMHRFLLSGGRAGEEARRFAILWGIMMIEPGRLPLPLLYEAAAREATGLLSAPDREVVRHRVAWACRPLQVVLAELSAWSARPVASAPCGPNVGRRVSELLDVQEQIGGDLAGWLDERFPDWLDDVAEETWRDVGGW